MRSDPADYELVVPGSLHAVLALLAGEPDWQPIAGGTDIMVSYAAGKLSTPRLVSIWNLPELRRIEIFPNEIRIGAACTYTDLRESSVVANEFPLLARAASWTGGIANQNRGTLGGNIVNASPAADSLPALLAYDADLILISARGERRVAHRDFHLGYKTMLLAPGELIRSVCLPRVYAGYRYYARKVGSRNAQAIAKVCFAGLGLASHRVIEDVRIAIGAVAPVPFRLAETERILRGKTIDPPLLDLARKTAGAEVRPIDDIRSTARYRARVAANLVAEFLDTLRVEADRRHGELPIPDPMPDRLARWNSLPPDGAAQEILPCCGSRAWAFGVAARRPLLDEASLLAASDQVWNSLDEPDWLEAFASHPRLGESRAVPNAPAQSAAWSAQEQKNVAASSKAALAELAAANREYERRFGRIFIVSATGKSPAEILEILRTRLQNDAAAELREAAEQQRRIARIRLTKWLQA
jgi:OHCU decarboxylase